MTALFNHILNTGITAGILVLVVILLRFLLKKAPKYISVLLWGLVALRLVMPFSIESPLSLIPKTDWVVSESIPSPITPPADNVGSPDVPGDAVDIPDTPGSPIQSAPITPITPITPSEGSPTQSAPNTPITPITPEPTPTAPREDVSLTEVIPYVWLGGVAAMLLYMALSYLRVKQKVKVKSSLRDNIYLSNTASPFVLGIVKPKIYLPADMDDATSSYVIAHEETHIRRRDHLWKPLGFILLAVHWFNPLLWLSYILLCRDIEMACDERVIRDMGTVERANYSEALLNCSVRKRVVSACPLAFGEVGVKERIRSVLSYKKPAFWIVLVAVLACIATAVCFLTNPMGDTESYREEYSYLIMIKEDGISEILVSTPDSSGGCINADNSTFEKGEKIWLEHLDNVVDLRGIEVAALNEAGNTVYSVHFPENATNEEIGELLESTAWFIPPTAVLEKYMTPTDAPSETNSQTETSNNTTPEPPTDEEIKALFDDMIRLEYYQVDAYCYPDVFAPSGTPDVLKVIDEKYDTYDEWTAFVESIYTESALDMIQRRLSEFAFDADGYTHVKAGAMGYYLSEDYTYEIVEYTEDTAKITLTRTYAPVGLESTEEEFTYLLTKTGAGWRIADLVYETSDTGEPTEAPTNTPTEAPTETPAEAPTEAPIDTPNIDGGSSRCKHTVMAGYNDIDFAYHSFPGALISYVGSDKFDEWIGFYENNKEVLRAEYNEGKRDCPYGISIVDFVEYFEIPREVLKSLFYLMASATTSTSTQSTPEKKRQKNTTAVTAHSYA